MTSSFIPQSVPAASRLLVSVRSVAEAKVALQAGVEIIDIKEPTRGSLGMADPAVIQEVLETCHSRQPAVSVSCALGEVRDWLGMSPPGLSGGFRFAKLGLAGLCGSDWEWQWLGVRREWESRSPLRTWDWIAVIYADSHLAKSPAAQEIIDAASRTGCAGVLIDTWCKSSGSLLDVVTLSELESWLVAARERQLLTAIAGSLNVETIGSLRQLPVDILAVRGAACRQGQRTATICTEAVSKLKQILAASAVST